MAPRYDAFRQWGKTAQENGAICKGVVAVYFDSDTHIDECEDTWANMPESMKALTPVTTFLDKETLPPYIRPGYDRCWFIDGQLHNRQVRSDERTGTTVEIRELYDVPARLADMDSLNVGIQVLYPTLFLNELSEHPLLAVALCQSYNRWLAERCAESNGRIQWVAMMPLVDMEATLTEMRWAKEHGAVGVHKRAQEVQNRLPSDRYFTPFYAQARARYADLHAHRAGVVTGEQPPRAPEFAGSGDAAQRLQLRRRRKAPIEVPRPALRLRRGGRRLGALRTLDAPCEHHAEQL